MLLKSKMCVLYVLLKKSKHLMTQTSVFWLIFVLGIKEIRVKVLKQHPACSSLDAFTCGWLLL